MVIFCGIQNVYSPHETVNAEGAQCEQHFSRAAVTALLVHLCCVQADYQAIISPISFTGRQGE